MKSLLIQTLETICPGNVYLQGTIASEINYPDKFITLWTDYTEDISFYDDDVNSTEWNFTVYFYTNNPAEISTIPAQIEAALKAVGFIPQGRGHDLASDVETHTGWVQEFIIKEF